MARDYIVTSRHGTKYYFRRRVPDDLRLNLQHHYLVKSLGTGVRREAVILARHYATSTDRLFEAIRAMTKEDRSELQVNWVGKYEFADGQLQKVEIQAEAHEAEAVHSSLKKLMDDNKRSNNTLSATSKAPSLSIYAVFDLYKAEKISMGSNGGWKDGEATAKRDHWPYVRQFVEFLGDDRPIGAVTADDVARYPFHRIAIDLAPFETS